MPASTGRPATFSNPLNRRCQGLAARSRYATSPPHWDPSISQGPAPTGAPDLLVALTFRARIKHRVVQHVAEEVRAVDGDALAAGVGAQDPESLGGR